jgi:uncharacterized protein (DUF1786 family)
MSEFEDDYGEGHKAGILWEQERILALLEAHISYLKLEWFEMKWADLVALIRGENK